jgi:eukaryotic translation initiation factor 2C
MVLICVYRLLILKRSLLTLVLYTSYLQAHAGLQGTVRPTHYTVVYDENRLGADELQQGTHHASYLYARATKAVSLVPAAYYSDLACERGRAYINDFLNADDKTSSAGTGKGKTDREAEEERVFRAAKVAWGEGLHVDLKDSMFYI